MSKATKTKNKKNIAVSPKELKHWLNGILEFQTNDWAPDKSQWNTIKAKIFLLADEPETTPIIPQTSAVNAPSIQQQHPTRPQVQQPRSIMDEGGLDSGLMSSNSFPQISSDEFNRKLLDAKSGISNTGSPPATVDINKNYE